MAELGEKEARTWAMSCHLSALAGFIIPFGNIIGPLVHWLIKRNESAVIDAEGKKALNFQISVLIYAIISFLLTFVVIGMILLPAVGIFSLVMIIIAAVKTNNGEDFNYPLSINFIK